MTSTALKDHIRLNFVIRVDSLQVIHVRTGLNQSNDAHIKEKVTHSSLEATCLTT